MQKLASELQTEAMRNTLHAKTASEYRSGSHSSRTFFTMSMSVLNQHGSAGGGLHCEAQGERLAQCLITPRTSPSAVTCENVRTTNPNTNVQIEETHAEIIKQLLRPKELNKRMRTEIIRSSLWTSHSLQLQRAPLPGYRTFSKNMLIFARAQSFSTTWCLPPLLALGALSTR